MLIHDVLKYLKRQAKYAVLVQSNPKMYTYEGILLPLRETPELQHIRRAVYEGNYENCEIDAIRHLLRPDDIVLELGAGCGVVSAFIAKHLSDSSNLHTFEANPRLMASISSVASANGLTFNVTNAAVGINNGEADFFFDEHFLASSFYDHRRKNAVKARVEVVAITELLERIRPTVLVFDIEGAERDVLSIPIPQQVRAICGELHPGIIGDHAVSDVIRNILNQGFDFLVDWSEGRAIAFARPG